MKRWMPHPWMALVLFVVWLLLQQSVAPGTLIVGIVLAVALSWVLGRLRPPPVHVRKPWMLALLLVRVLLDIVRSNLAVAGIIVLQRPYNSGFITMPLALTSPYALVALACIITATPGTIWVRHDPEHQLLTIHVLDLVDEATWIATVKRRYEGPLLEVFQ